ncbi:MAG: hypothetical protein DSY60_01435, partial [Persephonella sp.]
MHFFIFNISFASHIIFLLDRSTSMKINDRKDVSKFTVLYIMKEIAYLNDTLDNTPENKISLITFSDDAKIIGNSVSTIDEVENLYKLPDLDIKSNQNTELYGAIQKIYKIVRETSDNKYYVVVLTDGIPDPVISSNNKFLKSAIGENKLMRLVEIKNKYGYEKISLRDLMSKNISNDEKIILRNAINEYISKIKENVRDIK